MAIRKLRKLLWALFRSRRGLQLVLNRCAPAIEHAAVLRSFRPECVLDVGANVGQFAAVVRAIHPDATLVLFEPLPAAASRLRNLFDRDAGISVEQMALSSVDGMATFHVSRRSDSSSLLAITPRQTQENAGTEEACRIEVPVYRLESWLAEEAIPHNCLLKLDVQGAELDVLRGAGQLLGAVRWIYCEVSFAELYDGQPLASELIRFLFARGFEISAIANLAIGSNGVALQADVLFHNVSYVRCDVGSTA